MADETIKIDYELNTSGAIDRLESLLIKQNELTKLINEVGDKSSHSYKELSNSISDTEEEIKKLYNSSNDVKIVVSQTASTLKELKQSQKDLVNAMLQTKQGTDEYKRLQNALAEVRNKLKDVGDTIQSVSGNRIENFNSSWRLMLEGFQQFDGKKIADSFNTMGGAAGIALGVVSGGISTIASFVLQSQTFKDIVSDFTDAIGLTNNALEEQNKIKAQQIELNKKLEEQYKNEGKTISAGLSEFETEFARATMSAQKFEEFQVKQASESRKQRLHELYQTQTQEYVYSAQQLAEDLKRNEIILAKSLSEIRKKYNEIVEPLSPKGVVNQIPITKRPEENVDISKTQFVDNPFMHPGVHVVNISPEQILQKRIQAAQQMMQAFEQFANNINQIQAQNAQAQTQILQAEFDKQNGIVRAAQDQAFYDLQFSNQQQLENFQGTAQERLNLQVAQQNAENELKHQQALEQYNLQVQQQKQIEEVQKKSFETAKALNIANVVMDSARAIIGTWAGYAKEGFIGTTAATVQTAFIAGLAATQIALIANQKFQAQSANIQAPQKPIELRAITLSNNSSGSNNGNNSQSQNPLLGFELLGQNNRDNSFGGHIWVSVQEFQKVADKVKANQNRRSNAA